MTEKEKCLIALRDRGGVRPKNVLNLARISAKEQLELAVASTEYTTDPKKVAAGLNAMRTICVVYGVTQSTETQIQYLVSAYKPIDVNSFRRLMEMVATIVWKAINRKFINALGQTNDVVTMKG